MAEKTEVYNDRWSGPEGVTAELISVTVNGEVREIQAHGSVAELLRHLELPTDRVAVELDKTIVRKRDWNSTLVDSGARLEIVEFVGGG